MDTCSRRLTAMIVLIILAAGLAGCAPSREERLQSRYEDFVAILPPAAAGAIDDGDYELATVRVDSALMADTVFAREWSALKKKEAIELFSTGDVIDYFVTYFGMD